MKKYKTLEIVFTQIYLNLPQVLLQVQEVLKIKL